MLAFMQITPNQEKEPNKYPTQIDQYPNFSKLSQELGEHIENLNIEDRASEDRFSPYMMVQKDEEGGVKVAAWREVHRDETRIAVSIFGIEGETVHFTSTSYYWDGKPVAVNSEIHSELSGDKYPPNNPQFDVFASVVKSSDFEIDS